MRKASLPASMIISVVLLASAVLPGCNFVYRQPIFQGNLLEKTSVDQIKPGMSQAQVAALLGTPPVADPFHHERWDYVASERRDHGDVQIKNLTLWFDGAGALAKMEGEYFPEEDAALLLEERHFGFQNLPKEKDKKKH